MKKFAIMATMALTMFCFGGQTLTADAAAQRYPSFSLKGNRVFMSYGSECSNFQNILDRLQNCFPEITLPDCNLPDNNKPETGTPDTDIPGTDDSEDSNEHAYIREVADLVNAERAKEGLAPLSIDSKVQAAAQIRAAECEQSFSHTRPNGSSFATALTEQNVSYKRAGENIAWGQRSAQEVVNAWMNSSGHRANIMNADFTTIGVGYYQSANGTGYWCQLFTR